MASAENLTSWVRLAVPAALLASLACVVAPAAASAAAAPTRTLGSVTVHRCAGAKVAWCGTLKRPWSSAQPALGSLSVGFRVFLPPAKSQGTIAAVEGGPGYPSTGSAPEYRTLYRPLLKTHTLLLMDNRGTGTTALIRCAKLQNYQGRTDTAAFQALVGKCGASLGARVGLYRTFRATDDLAAVVHALGLGKIDLYGDSYGSWFAQVFAHRHPAMLRSLVLDSTYSRTDIDPWYRSTLATERTAFQAVCTRDVACSKVGGNSWSRIAKLVAQLRHTPIKGWTRDPEGARDYQVVTVRTMVDVTADAGFDPLMYRDMDAAVRAAEHGIHQPLLRLAATAASNDNSTGSAARWYSDGQYFAVSCADYPQLFSMTDPIAARPAQLQASLASAPSAALKPFTPSEWISMNQYSEAFTGCLDWPQLPANDPGANAAGSGPAVPTLVLGGDLDSWTPLTDAVGITKTLGPLARLVTLKNAVHTATEGDVVPTAATRCGRSIVQRFVRDPAAIKTLNARCGARVAPIHTPGAFPLKLSGASGATVVSGRAAVSTRKAATVAVQAIGDATQSWWADDNSTGAGLYGGTFHGEQTGNTVAFTLTNDRFVSNARVTGRATWRIGTGAVQANLTVRSAGRTYRFVLSYSQTTPRAVVISARARLSTPAP